MHKQMDISPGRRMETRASRKDQSLRGGGSNQDLEPKAPF